MKGIPEDKHVSKIIYNFESTVIQSWVMNNEACLTTLMFTAFFLDFKKKLLVSFWEDELVADQILLQRKEEFLSWIIKVHNTNTELGIASSPYHIEPAHFHHHLVHHLSAEMKHFYCAQIAL